jgi:undecaprenyl-diphosphatase
MTYSLLYFHICLILQVFVELLPVSSSGHVLLLQQWVTYLKPTLKLPPTDLFRIFIDIAHLPTALVVFYFYRYELIAWYSLPTTTVVTCAVLLLLASSVTGVLYKTGSYWSPSSTALPIGFMITGFLLYLTQWCVSSNVQQELTITNILILGVAQGIAFFPGISRFALVFTTARFLNFSATQAFGLTWFLHVPLMIGAGSIGLLKLWYYHAVPCLHMISYLLTLLVSGMMSYFLFDVMYIMAQEGQLWRFGIYLVVPFVLSLLYYRVSGATGYHLSFSKNA